MGLVGEDDDALLDEQRSFYRARAPECDEWWQRRGRYQRGEDAAGEWHRQVGVIDAALTAFNATGNVLEMAGGTVAEHLGLPFVSAAVALPINLDASVPSCIFPWAHRVGISARLRNRVGNAALEWIFSGVLRTINRQRRAWGLPPSWNINALFSGLAQVSPKIFSPFFCA